jgi:DNA-binding transcriptional LysR family regulator
LVGSNWPPHQVTRPSHPHGDRRHRQHGEGGAELRISHPAISKTISDIEGTLGVRLLDRGSQGAELTAYGEVLLRCGTNIFDEMQQGLRSLEYLSDPNSGEVRLGCTDIILHSLVPTIARRFSKEHPGVQLDVKLTNPGHHQIKELRERKIIASGEFVGILPTSVKAQRSSGCFEGFAAKVRWTSNFGRDRIFEEVREIAISLVGLP